MTIPYPKHSWWWLWCHFSSLSDHVSYHIDSHTLVSPKLEICAYAVLFTKHSLFPVSLKFISVISSRVIYSEFARTTKIRFLVINPPIILFYLLWVYLFCVFTQPATAAPHALGMPDTYWNLSSMGTCILSHSLLHFQAPKYCLAQRRPSQIIF